MPRLTKEYKQAVQAIPLDELQKIVLKAASQNPNRKRIII